MKIKPLHSWDLTPKEAITLQKKLAGKVRIQHQKKKPKIIAGTDLSFSKNSNRAFAGMVLLDFKTLTVIGEYLEEGEVRFPYVPGLLSFREAPLLINLFKKVEPSPDCIFMDGQGIAHPRGIGLASHLGLFLDIPTIGCAKSKLTGNYKEPGTQKGSVSNLVNNQGETIGAAVRTRQGCKPIFVSVGYCIDLEQAVDWTLHCAARYRIPEPTRLAHNLVTKIKKSMDNIP